MGGPEQRVGVRHGGRGRVLTRTIRQERAAACTQWSVDKDMALWDGTREGLAAWLAARRNRPLQSRQAQSPRFQPPPFFLQALAEAPQGQTV